MDKQATTLLELSKMVATINLKFKHMNLRIEKSSNGYSASINRSKTNYHSHGINSIQTSFPNSIFKILKVRIGNQEKIGLASLHLKGRALERFQGYKVSNKEIKWTQFYIDVVSRFRPNVYDSLMG